MMPCQWTTDMWLPLMTVPFFFFLISLFVCFASSSSSSSAAMNDTHRPIAAFAPVPEQIAAIRTATFGLKQIGQDAAERVLLPHPELKQTAMAREKIEIKKIANATARQVTFSKRRRGLFKKAHELSILCDAEVALIIFSSTGKLYDYCSSSMKVLLERYENDFREKGTARDQEIDNGDVLKAQQQVAELERARRQMLGEDLEGLSLKQLQILEANLETALNRVRNRKGVQILKDINDLQRKGQEILEENNRLRQQLRQRYNNRAPLENFEAEESLPIGQLLAHEPPQSQSSDSISTSFSLKLGNGVVIPDNEVSDTSLHLGLPSHS